MDPPTTETKQEKTKKFKNCKKIFEEIVEKKEKVKPSTAAASVEIKRTVNWEELDADVC